MNLPELFQTVLIYALPVLLSITVHEAAHGYVARYLGDPTAANLGRVTLNPFKHIDLVGTILMPLFLIFATSGTFLFGYAKPVPVNFGGLRNPKRDMVWVALAGPASNFIQAIAWAALFTVLVGAGVTELFFLKMAHGGVLVNLLIGIFNLLPLPPLDGGRILVGLLPWKQAQAVSRIEPFGFFIVIALALTGVVGTWWLLPLMRLGNAAISLLLTPLTALMGLQLPPDLFIRTFQ